MNEYDPAGVTNEWRQWQVGDYILAGDGPLCVYTGTKGFDEMPYGIIIRPHHSHLRVGQEWSLDCKTPFNRRLTKTEAVKILLFGDIGGCHEPTRP